MGVASADINAYVSQLPPANERNVLNQKYIALFTQFLEAWSDYRRTGYPDFLIKKDDVIFSGVIEGQPVTYTFSPLFGDGGVPSRLLLSNQRADRQSAKLSGCNSSPGE
jgi:hypothetical protein